ncbi:uncharacterized protein L201_002428 [Kwoniella dendrophila CBS 6074]|uniref:Calcineurin-like phosphoesterase domain-containing protein n=1 Tax=Kwoniella dendrophila CBS 6074 TaxID=1295534 RepID=A0AAX4JSV5_9TREE
MRSPRDVLYMSIITSFFIYLLYSRWNVSTSIIQPDVPNKGPHGKHAFRQRLIAVGDLHGDISNTKKVLQMTKLINAKSDWTGGQDILVQTGDIVDRGANALDIYKLMSKLRSQSTDHGGKVISILGNHEFMNAIGDWRYVTEDDIRVFGGTKRRQEALAKDGWLGAEWLANYSITASVPLSPFPRSPKLSFTHGSLRPSYEDLLPYPSKINEIGKSLLEKALTPPLAPPFPPYPYSGLPEGHTYEEAELYSEGGPLWWRGLAEREDENEVCQWADDLKNRLGVRRIIGGHTPNFEQIVSRCNGSIIIIDTGISSAYGGVLSAMEIIYTLTPLKDKNNNGHDRQEPFLIRSPASSDPDSANVQIREKGDMEGTEQEISTEKGLKGRYIEREEVHAIYERRSTLIAVEERELML